MALTMRARNSYSTSARTPRFGALAIPLAYVVVATAYIVFSGRIAAMLASDTEHLAAIETVKGLGFVIVTGSLLFVLCFLWRRRLHAQTILLVKSESRAMAGRASGSAAHDLNNLLMALSGLLEGLKDQEQGNAFLTATRRELEVSIDQLSHLSRRLVLAARGMEFGEECDVELSKRIPLIAKLVSRHPDVRRCTLTIPSIDPVKVRLNVSLFEQAVLNLIINAAQAAGPGGKVELSVRGSDDTVVLQVDDSGPGISPEDCEAIFAPGYTTKKDGSGLGLLCVRAFADSCNGKVSIERSKLGGAAFRVQVPAIA